MKTILKPFLLTAIIIVTFSCKKEKKEAVPGTTKTHAVPVHITSETVHYKVDTTELKGYLAYDESDSLKRPGIIIVHEWWGHNEYVRERADMLAKLGYTAFALDMYGDGKLAQHPDDAKKFVQSVMSDINVAKTRFEAGMEILKHHKSVDSTKIGAIGYCFGGSVVLVMANMGEDLDAVAVFHGGLIPPTPTKNIKGKILVCNGADDPFIPAEAVETFKRQMDSVGADYTYISYPGTKHSFTSKIADSLGKKFNLPLEYNPDADAKSWKELQSFLSEAFN